MRRGRTLVGVGAVLAAVLALLAVFDLAAAGRAFLFAWLFWLCVPLGALALMLTHGLTGGNWGEGLRPYLAPLVAWLPAVALLAVLPALVLGRVYGWAEGLPDDMQEVGHYWLNTPFFLIRSVVALGVLAGLALILPKEAPASVLVCGLGFLLYVPAVTVLTIDWAMSLSPEWSSTTFPFVLGIQAILQALALVVPLAARGLDPATRNDLGGLLLALVLGTVYLAFMQYLVIWSGDLPAKVSWYAARGGGPWPALIVLALVVGGLVPFLLLLAKSWRSSAPVLEAAGACAFVGSLLHTAWMILPTWSSAWPLWLGAAVAAVALGGLYLGAAHGVEKDARRIAHA